MAKKSAVKPGESGSACLFGRTSPRDASTTKPQKTSTLVDTRAIYCGDNLDQLKKLPDDLIYVDLPFSSNRNYEKGTAHHHPAYRQKTTGREFCPQAGMS